MPSGERSIRCRTQIARASDLSVEDPAGVVALRALTECLDTDHHVLQAGLVLGVLLLLLRRLPFSGGGPCACALAGAEQSKWRDVGGREGGRMGLRGWWRLGDSNP